MPDLEYGRHARDRMDEREVTEQDVEQALSRRIGSPDAGQPGSVWIRGYAAGGRILKVCVRADDHQYVITVAWVGQGG